jgi:glycosyltransferase involved in cell wall biosynthesis
MLCGRPAVVTDVGGNAEWIAEPETGFVAEAPTAKSFGAALERAWQARDHWQKLGMQAHKEALRKFDPASGRSLLNVVLDASQSYKPDSTGDLRR